MADGERPEARAPLALGDYVRIKHSAGLVGRIVELRGGLGPDGALVYRVLVDRKPVPSHVEVLGDQLEVASAPKPKPRRKVRPGA
ncbi:MAG: hypothetical protein BGO49_26340 [Planctomycetales bacterium 71-10]|nr:MAG: hypothetical protein BGO49_26340 [Planctomycetales bacterium 71-10]